MRALWRYMTKRQISLGLIFLIVVMAWLSVFDSPGKALEAPTGLSLEREEYDLVNARFADKIFLAWDLNPAGDVNTYRVYRSHKQISPTENLPTEYKPIGVAETNSFTDNELHLSPWITAMYYYRVAVIDNAGSEGPLSPKISIKYTPYGIP
jgi:fibronectin type 3 domain-containing protein